MAYCSGSSSARQEHAGLETAGGAHLLVLQVLLLIMQAQKQAWCCRDKGEGLCLLSVGNHSAMPTTLCWPALPSCHGRLGHVSRC